MRSTIYRGISLAALVFTALASNMAQSQSVISGTCPYCTLRDVISVKDSVSSSQPGATGNGSTDDTAAIERAIARCPANGCTILFPAGIYKISSTIQVSRNNIEIVGQGKRTSVLDFEPSSSGQAALLIAGPLSCSGQPCSDIVRDSVSDIGIRSENTSVTKSAIRAIGVEEMKLEDISVWGSGGSGDTWSGGSPSIGLEIHGHEFATISNVAIDADEPIFIGTNPITYPAGRWDISHFHFRDLYLTAGNYPCVHIGDPVILLQVTFDGLQAWVGGTHGLFWDNATASAASNGLVVSNLRTEQGKSSSGFTIYLNSSGAEIQNVVLSAMYPDPYRNGIYLRNTYWTTVQNFTYGGVGVALDANGGNAHLSIRNSFFQVGSSLGSGTIIKPAGDGWVNTN